jgi:hypothetical protein
MFHKARLIFLWDPQRETSTAHSGPEKGSLRWPLRRIPESVTLDLEISAASLTTGSGVKEIRWLRGRISLSRTIQPSLSFPLVVYAEYQSALCCIIDELVISTVVDIQIAPTSL